MAWICAVRLELVLKTVVIPLVGGHAYVAVYEWSPTGAMVHLHYIIWKGGAPRFDLEADKLVERAKLLRRAGLVAGSEVSCGVRYVVDFLSRTTLQSGIRTRPLRASRRRATSRSA